ncbi:signal peptidase II [Actinomycetospora endophytica]|uniref:Lipoprotein signal peptidase n=1 Tax=Actinomycetospora endophytica TaxID=2291215 RepID=A0ABS8PEU6_9PSEU|nr:signal peptidase II [Actinomycetospora endophytica]MCD2196447.1 signal peptidase II [Actinomycetospora endophytica]
MQSATPGNDPSAPSAADAPDESGPAGTTDPAVPRRRLVMLVVTAVVVLAIDIGTKVLVVATMTDGQRIPLIGDVVSLYLIRNSGAAFSLATGMTWVLTLVAIAVVVGIVRFARQLGSRGWALALGLVLGGALGNLADRFFRGPGPLEGHVVDFVSVGWWPVFNAADSAICCGGALLVFLALWGIEIDGHRSGRDPEASR